MGKAEEKPDELQLYKDFYPDIEIMRYRCSLCNKPYTYLVRLIRHLIRVHGKVYKGWYDLTCLQCSHSWISRVENPDICPKCKSPQWNKHPVGEDNK